MNDLAVNVVGEVAVVTFNGHFAGRLGGAAIVLDQQCTMVFVRADDDWKIIHEHMSPLGTSGSTGGRPAEPGSAQLS